MLREFRKWKPKVHPSAYVHPTAEVIGRVVIGRHVSIWPMVVLRGDIEPIVIGDACNLQDSAIAHTSHGIPVRLGKGVTVGHGAILHGTRVGDCCLIGMGAILLDHTVVGSECLIGAGAVLPEGMRVPPRSLVVGVPGRVRRRVTRDEIKMMHDRARNYIRYADDMRRYARTLY